jgi:hypothetical protein
MGSAFRDKTKRDCNQIGANQQLLAHGLQCG